MFIFKNLEDSTLTNHKYELHFEKVINKFDLNVGLVEINARQSNIWTDRYHHKLLS